MLVLGAVSTGASITVALLVAMAVLWCLAIVNGVSLARHYQAWRRELDGSGSLPFRWLAIRPPEIRRQLEPLLQVLWLRRNRDDLTSSEAAMRRRFNVFASSMFGFIAVALVASLIRWLT
jgi:hypothetical protein